MAISVIYHRQQGENGGISYEKRALIHRPNPWGGGHLNSPKIVEKADKNGIFSDLKIEEKNLKNPQSVSLRGGHSPTRQSRQLVAATEGERNDNLATKSKHKTKIIALILSLTLLFIATIGGTMFVIFNKTNATIEGANVTTNLFNTDGTINTTSVNELLTYIKFWDNPNNTNTYTAHNITTRSSGNIGGSVVFPMGYKNGTSGDSLYWQATYLYKDYLTVWLTEPYITSVWNTSKVSTSNYDSYANSTIQNYIANTFYPLVTQSSGTLQAIFATPKLVGYQILKTGISEVSYPFTTDGSGLSSCDNMPLVIGERDFMWLPSWSEVAWNDSSNCSFGDAVYSGQWGLNNTDRKFSNTISSACSLRSGTGASSYTAALGLEYEGNDWIYATVTTAYGVRPAAHISLKELAQYIDLEINMSADNLIEGTVNKEGISKLNQSITITATPNSGYLFDYWMVDGVRVEKNPYSFVITDDVNCVAYFKSGVAITATSSNTSYGTVNGGGTYESGTLVYLTASPKAGYGFAYWQDSGGGQYTTNPLSVSATTSQTYTAVFKQYYTATITGNQSFTTDIERNQNYYATYYLTAGSGYYFNGITIDGNTILFENTTGSIATSPNCLSIDYKINQPANILALTFNYLINNISVSVTLNTSAPTIENNNISTSASIDGVVVQSTIGGSAELVGDDYENLEDGDTITVVARLKLNGYQFDGWYINDELISSDWSARLNYDDVKGKIITAKFSETSANVNTETNNTGNLT
ncbi:MAG: hypothetical protein IJ301_01955 [Clostridia bacterium]|nr:hypothetical protein [Clostridia bacterium]